MGEKVGTQLALPLDLHDAPELRELGVWDRLLADYGSTGVTLQRAPDGADAPRPARARHHQRRLRHARATAQPVTIAGLVIARQRPATAKGVTFMLLEDEHGTLNLIVPPPVHERCRMAVRGEPLVIADGRLERREGIVNVLVHDVRRLERGDLPKAEVRHIEPSAHVEQGGGGGRRRPGGGDAGGQQLRPRPPLGHYELGVERDDPLMD